MRGFSILKFKVLTFGPIHSADEILIFVSASQPAKSRRQSKQNKRQNEQIELSRFSLTRGVGNVGLFFAAFARKSATKKLPVGVLTGTVAEKRGVKIEIWVILRIENLKCNKTMLHDMFHGNVTQQCHKTMPQLSNFNFVRSKPATSNTVQCRVPRGDKKAPVLARIYVGFHVSHFASFV